MTCSSAAVEPTSDSALPIRAKLFWGPDRVGIWPPLSPKIRDFRGAIGTYGCVTRTRYKREKEAGGKKGRGERTENTIGSYPVIPTTNTLKNIKSPHRNYFYGEDLSIPYSPMMGGD